MKLVIAAIFWASSGLAIVNIESLRTGAAQPGEKVAATVSAKNKRGVSRTQDYDVIAFLERRTVSWEALLVAEYEFESLNDGIVTNSKFVHWRNGFQRQNNWYPEIFVQHKVNGVARLSERTLAGGGMRYKAWHEQGSRLFFGIGAFQAKEVLKPDPAADDDGTEDRLWLNSYMSFKVPVMENIDFHHVTYAQPATDDFDDVRVFSTYQFISSINPTVDVTFSFEYAYDSKPAQLAVTDTTELATILGIQF